ncbi:lipoyl synthase [Fervidibacter sacchari]|uniref:Lipoyl synthase n=1 Tax=Candidatus Fervidibacter sacchari TaxID=1448929 RepID=A0ABT2EQV7_9BACT|nr:lipoyl synthase [Candidatus Fervidibacter sacchari]MCS3919285.1 lipoic acid synthetase [Candidatus Fervidibacter sacchari]WKU15025.1 lipoyl synthase [Candidatus Fervidibacter sacchari]
MPLATHQLPIWIRSKVPKRKSAEPLRQELNRMGINTVCQSARCPNIGECFSRGTATFMLLGETCTRRCGFCAVKTGRGEPVDPYEPLKVATMVHKLNLRHAVITSVARDDLPDQGANQFAKTVRAIKFLCPNTTVEVLTPDFKARPDLIAIVVESSPDVYNHNVETVPRLQKLVRPQASYERSLKVLEIVKELRPQMLTKSGLMVGLGETVEEVVQVLKDLRSIGCDIVTIGQYIRPTARHLPVARYVTPEEFAELERIGYELGFKYVFAGPFVRSSYLADVAFESATARPQ